MAQPARHERVARCLLAALLLVVAACTAGGPLAPSAPPTPAATAARPAATAASAAPTGTAGATTGASQIVIPMTVTLSKREETGLTWSGIERSNAASIAAGEVPWR